MAAQIAVRTVREFMEKGTGIKKVVFNVFKDLDKQIYEELLRKGTGIFHDIEIQNRR